MADVTVDYKGMPGKAVLIQGLGESLNKELSSAWNSIDELRNTWYGTRYNSLISYFNKAVEDINNILRLVIDEIPTSLTTIAKNYATFDTDVTSAIAGGNITPMEMLPDSDTSTMSYKTDAAVAVQNQVNSNFANAIQCMNEIESTFNGIEWESTTREEYASRLSALKNGIIEELDEINSQFTSLMQAAQTDIEAAERANAGE